MEVFLSILMIIVSIVMTVLVLAQEGKSAGLTSSFTGGNSESYWSRNKGRSKEGTLERVTRILAILFILLAILLQLDL